MAAPVGLRPEPPLQQRVAVLHLRLAPPATAAGLNAALVGAGLAVSALAPEVERLEDVFLALTEDGDVPR